MSPFSYGEHALYCEGVALAEIAARVGTPCYVYSAGAILANFRAYDQTFGAMPHTICYAVKANGNLAVLRLLADAGAGFDIVSGGELFRVLKAGGDPGKVVFSGVGKSDAEIAYALEQGVKVIDVESGEELARVSAVAKRLKRRAPIALRVNPAVDPRTHPYIATGLRESKFGVGVEESLRLYLLAAND